MNIRHWAVAFVLCALAVQASANSQQGQNSSEGYKESGALQGLYEASELLSTLARPSIVLPVERLVSDNRARAVITRHLGWDIVSSPAYEQFKTMSLQDVARNSQGVITDDMLRRIEAEFERF